MNLIKIIQDVINKPRAKPTYKTKPRFKPSDLGSPCLRKIYYSYNRVEEDYEASVQLKQYGRLGDAAHDRISGTLREAGILIDYYNDKGKPVKRFGKIDLEFPLKDPDLEVSAKIDAVMVINGYLWLGEWKTIGNFPFGKLAAVKPEHLTQGAMYLYMFKRALTENRYPHIKELDPFLDVVGIKFLYENRDNGQMKEFEITDASQVFKDTVNKMLTIKQHIKNNELPPKTQDWCKSCPWRDKCYKNFIV